MPSRGSMERGREGEPTGQDECRGWIVGASPRMSDLRALIQRIACVDSPVLISGEVGSGKRSVAEAIHYSGPRSAGPFIVHTCDAGSAEEVERELLEERLPCAAGGTLVLEEVGALPVHAQVRLLNAFQERTRPGFRVIATTTAPLRDAVSEGTFRRDLYFALSVVPIEVPPLRERLGDLTVLVEQWSEHFVRRNNLRFPGFTAGALDLLRRHAWPGNLRELESVLERAVVLAGTERPLDVSAFHFLHEQSVPAERNGAASAADPLITLDELERRHVLRALEYTRQNRTRAANLLNISVRTLRNKLHQYRSQGLLEL